MHCYVFKIMGHVVTGLYAPHYYVPCPKMLLLVFGLLKVVPGFSCHGTINVFDPGHSTINVLDSGRLDRSH